MKKLITLIFTILAVAGIASADTLASWSFDGQSTTSTSEPADYLNGVLGVTAASVNDNGQLININRASAICYRNIISADSQAEAISLNSCIEVVVGGSGFTVTNISMRISSWGSANFATYFIRSSADGYASDVVSPTLIPTLSQTPDIVSHALSVGNGPVTLRIYAYDHTGVAAAYSMYMAFGSLTAGLTDIEIQGTEGPPPSIPATPTNLSATVISAYAIDLSWGDASNNEDGFIIERGPDAGSLVAIATNAASDATYSDTGLNPSTEYWYRVSAYNGVGSSTNNPVASATTDSLAAPSTPTSLSATAISTDAINLTWTDTSNVEDGFIIERGPDTNSFVAIATNAVDDTTYSDTSLAPSTEYWYRVSAYNGIGSSTGNPAASATTLTPSGLGTVFSDGFTGSDNTAITNTDWGYIDLGVEISGGSIIPRTAPAADIFEIRGNELFAEITPLETADSATYNKVMTAIYPESGGSPISATIASGEKVVFEADLTDYVNNLGNMWGISQQVKLVLSKRAGTYSDPYQAAADTNYVLVVTVHQSDNANQISVQGTYNNTGTQIATPSVNFTNSAALPLHLTMEHYSSGTTVCLVNGTLVGMLSGTALPTVNPYLWFGKFNGGGTELTAGSVTLDNVEISIAGAGSAPDAATDFGPSSMTSGTINLSWTDAATTELGYRLERKTGAAPYAEIAVLAVDATSYTDTGLLDDGTVYEYRLKAFNGAGESSGVETSATASDNPFFNWAVSYPVLSGSKANTEDYDNDGASDYREYALNGNPTNGADTGMVEATTDGTILTYIYAKRTDDNTIVYTLVDTTDLLLGQEFTNNWDGQTVGPSGVENFDLVTNTYNMVDSQRFIKLIIE